MRSEGKFYDDKNFPRGFNRSGVFTISEAMLLENYGRTSMLATMIVTESDEDLLNLVQTLLNQYQKYLLENKVVSGVTEVADIEDKHRVLVVRAMGNGTEPIMMLFSQIWQTVRQHWQGRLPSIPRIWAT